MEDNNYKIAIIGLGYVGLPLAISFSKIYDVTAIDINTKRVEELKLQGEFVGWTSTSNLKPDTLISQV